METAFVMIICDAGATGQVTKKLQLIDEIKETIPVWGAYDVVVKITAPTTEALRDTIRQKVRTTDNVRTTVTLTLVESQT